MRVWLSRDSCIDSASSYIWNCVYLELVWTWDRGRVCLWCTQVYVVADVVETGPADVTFQFKVIFLSETKMMLIELDGTWISQSLPYVWRNVFLWPPIPQSCPNTTSTFISASAGLRLRNRNLSRGSAKTLQSILTGLITSTHSLPI